MLKKIIFGVTPFVFLLFSLGPSLTVAPGCGGGGGGTSEEGGDCFDCGSSEAAFLHLDSENIAALLSVDPDTIESAALSALKAQTEGVEGSPVQGIEEDGDIRDALFCFLEETGESFEGDSLEGLSADCWDMIPRIVTIAECGGVIYLVFERSFIVRTVCPDGTRIEDYSDPWSASSCFTSQLLRTTEPVTDYQPGDRLERANLEPVLTSLEINTWDRRRNIQFDGSCNLYVTAHVPGTGNDVLLKVAPDAPENDYDEVINARICYERYLVTAGGDVHYTGRTSVGSDCSGDSFYRVVSSGGVLSEITRGWWDYGFEPREDDGTVVFYGPDPTADGVPSWDSACLFEFDGTQTGDARYTKLVNCISDWWRYVSEGPDDAEFQTVDNDTERERCGQQFYTYRGSNAPDEILSIDRDGGDGTDEICVVSDVEYKRVGEWRCNICIDDGVGHCENSSGMLTGDTTAPACVATVGNAWSVAGECYNDVTTSACTIAQPAGWNLNHDWCQDPGQSWSLTYAGLSCILADKSVELISSTSEVVTNAWRAGGRIVYSAVEDGAYSLKAVTFDDDGAATVTELVSGVEMYEVAADPTEGVDRLLVNGLRFEDNSYVFGHYDFEAGELLVETGLTGLVETILILGD